MLIVQERERWGGGSQPLHQREAESLQGARVSALISVSSHLADRRKTVTLAKLLNWWKEDERKQGQISHEVERLHLKRLEGKNWRRYSIEPFTRLQDSPLRWLRPSPQVAPPGCRTPPLRWLHQAAGARVKETKTDVK